MKLPRKAIWQLIGEDEWRFGVPVRGVIREPLADIYFTEGRPDQERDYGWIWIVLVNGSANKKGGRGKAFNLISAVKAAEKALQCLV